MNFFFEKIRLIFDVENWVWKYDFGTFWRTVIQQRIFLKQIPLSMLILGQFFAFKDPPSLKFHDRTDITTHFYPIGILNLQNLVYVTSLEYKIVDLTPYNIYVCTSNVR